MPDLSTEACHRFWFEYNDPAIYKAICFLESVEDWTLENTPQIQDALNQLGTLLENIGKVDFKDEALFVETSSHLKTSQILRMLQALDSAHPGAASKVLVYAEENAGNHETFAPLFIQRNIAFERLRLLSRIFSRSRMKLAIEAIESEDATTPR
jgi:intracellular multiplication protein IcmW